MIELRPQFASASDLVGWLNLWPTRLSPKSSKRKRTLRDWSQKLFSTAWSKQTTFWPRA